MLGHDQRVPGDREDVRVLRGLEVQHHRRGVRGGDAGQRGQAAVVGGRVRVHGVERVSHVRARERRAVGELDSGAQVDGQRLAAVGPGEALAEHGVVDAGLQ